ncbi:class 1 isoprenoid biosynthesis enzyme [Paenibacillus sp. IHBB 10380]|uniref:class 1 isoprenoid biosynthesis enzyme n=1 Tax=Paenibacillus sp. IHBB 10380 TaxID=1566358 RepID=UPI0005CFC0C0|nr:class 1 isoprenoid biosynthesis enzyme [Paenibacillus sp. IHBB 10380]AJS57385.1 hypothetical protein UB51_01530 [Paenibacillus sp. IHBB 10380]
MEWLKEFDNEISQVFVEAQEIISQFPPSLDHKGLSYLNKFNIHSEDSTKNYICYLLPFWMKETSTLSNEDYRKLSLGNVFAMLYFFIQDDLMDEPSNSDRSQLILSNLFYLHFLDIYRSYFASDSPFWTYFNQYIREWSDGLTNENHKDYFQSDPSMIAKKSAPLKLSSTGILLLSGQNDLIPTVSDLVERVLITLQMSDDWVDWQEDLADGNYNSLLSMIKKEHYPHQILTVDSVKTSIYVRSIMKNYVDIATANHQYLLSRDIQLTHLLSFHEMLVNDLSQDAQEIEESRILQQQGGLHYWLLENTRK